MRDVIVVGGGPSGSHAAYHCALLGLRTLLIEKEHYPRDKPCGGAVDAEMRERVSPDFLRVVEASTDRARLFYNFDELLRLGYENFYVDRKTFDEMLARRAQARGVDVLEGVRARRIIVDKSGAEVVCDQGSHRARIVIGADGVNSVVRASTGMEALRTRPDRFLAAVLELEVGEDKKNEILGDTDEHRHYNAYLFSGFIGLGWVFPKRGRVNIGLGGLAQEAARIRSLLKDFLRGLDIDPSLSRLVKWHMIPFRPLRRVYSDRVLLVGDAAGFVNPLSGAGIDRGMISGEFAARVCARACEKGDFSQSALSEYQILCAPMLRKLRAKARVVDLAHYFFRKNLYSDVSIKFFVKRFAPIATERIGLTVNA
ncbi:MAG: NAD(P)/FAD-dependent oxidoreductase [Thermoplasmata archaeon]